MEQLKLFDELDIPLARVVLSHTDKVADPGYHRDLLGSGACVVYDQGIRTPDQTVRLVIQMIEDGFTAQILLGTDGARRSLWTTLGGSPGLAALRTDLGARLTAGLGHDLVRQLWIDNPARILALV